MAVGTKASYLKRYGLKKKQKASLAQMTSNSRGKQLPPLEDVFSNDEVELLLDQPVLITILAVSTAITATPTKNETALTPTITPSTSSSTTQGVTDINTTITLTTTTSTPPPHFDWDIAGHLLAQRNLTIEQSFEEKEKTELQEQEQANVRRCRRFPLSKSGHCSVEIALTGTNLTAETVALWTARLDRFSWNQLASDSTDDDSSLQEEEGSLHKVFKFLACLRQNSNNLVKGADARLKSCVQWIDALRRVKRQ
ncbi:hypothetical protein TYRP_021077 [Tyrophagus putrescentiae]|nr:hypothetical protein TYRP_021077 [Tyrophagus putrescentiae]